MRNQRILILAVLVLVAVAAIALRPACAGQLPSNADYKLLAPITHDNLTIFPVVASRAFDTREFITDPAPGQPVRIRRGALGSFMVNVNKQTGIKVHRVN